MSDFDNPWKEGLNGLLPDFLAFFFPAIFAQIDWTVKPEPQDQELRQVLRPAELGRRVVDKLFKVRTLSGEPLWIWIHIEIQSQFETDFSKRMFTCHYRLFDLHGAHPVSLAVFGDENPHWRPQEYQHELWGGGLRFWYPAVKLLDFASRAEELEKDRNPIAAVVLAHLETKTTHGQPELRKARKTQLVRGLYDRGFDAETIVKIYKIIDWMMDLPDELQRGFRDDFVRWEQERHMPYLSSIERLGREEGLQQGLQQGRNEARAELRARLLQLLTNGLRRFGSSGTELATTLQSVEDCDVLQAALEALLDATTVAQVRDAVHAAQRVANEAAEAQP